MTPEEHQMLKETNERTERFDRFWFEPVIEGGKSRAWEHDQMAKHWKLGKFSFKAIMWLGGMIAAVSAFLVKWWG
jgi:hypothetical protein